MFEEHRMDIKIKNTLTFFELLKAGLWEKEVWLSLFEEGDFAVVYQLAEEQSVLGLVAAGIEHVKDVAVPKEIVLSFVGSALQLEQRNKAMNAFIRDIIGIMRMNGIYTLLIKGQGVAQCYERPLWRACGDVDLYLSSSNYEEAKKFLSSMASHIEHEEEWRQHLGMQIDSWLVELHGTMHSNLSKNINHLLDTVHKDIFYGGEVRSWNNDGVTVFLPSAINDVMIVFTHFISHFYVGGIGLKQICDWCRLLWTYRDSLNTRLLESRIKKAGLKT